jgi:hypothetical protein
MPNVNIPKCKINHILNLLLVLSEYYTIRASLTLVTKKSAT